MPTGEGTGQFTSNYTGSTGTITGTAPVINSVLANTSDTTVRVIFSRGVYAESGLLSDGISCRRSIDGGSNFNTSANATISDASDAKNGIIIYETGITFAENDFVQMEYSASSGDISSTVHSISMEDNIGNYTIPITSSNLTILNFEEGVDGQPATDYVGNSTTLDTRFSTEQARSGTTCLKTTIYQGQSSGYGAIFLLEDLFGRNFYKGDELWWRISLFFPNSFLFNTIGTGLKTTRTSSVNSSNDGRGRWDIYTQYQGAFLFAENEMERALFGANNPDPLPNASGFVSNPLAGGAMDKGQWVTLEHYFKLSDVENDAIVRVWREGVLIFEDMKTPNLREAPHLIKDVRFCTYWNSRDPDTGQQVGAATTQSSYIDDVIITDANPGDTDDFGNPYIGMSI